MEYIQGDWAAQGYNDPNQSQDIFFAAVHFKGEDNKLGASVSGQSVLFVDYILTLKLNDGKAIVFTGHYYDPELRAAFNIEVKVSKAGENLIKCDKIIKVAGEDSIESFIMERIADFTDFQVGGE